MLKVFKKSNHNFTLLISINQWCGNSNTVKPVLNGHFKIDKSEVFMENGSLMKMENIAECSPLEHSAIFLTTLSDKQY